MFFLISSCISFASIYLHVKGSFATFQKFSFALLCRPTRFPIFSSAFNAYIQRGGEALNKETTATTDLSCLGQWLLKTLLVVTRRAAFTQTYFTLITSLFLFKTLCYVYSLLPDYIILIQFMFRRTSTTTSDVVRFNLHIRIKH